MTNMISVETKQKSKIKYTTTVSKQYTSASPSEVSAINIGRLARYNQMKVIIDPTILIIKLKIREFYRTQNS
jgi:hypothetical protein